MKNSIRTAVIICFAFLGALPLRGQELSLEIPLWATPPTENNGLTGPETKVGSKGFTANVSYPVLKVYRADAARNTGTAVLIAPGGGYGALAMRQEGDPFAAWLAGQGITGVVLKYRMPNGHHRIPLEDAKQGMRLIREHAREWQIDTARIGVMGFSAGGHLAATLLTRYEATSRPAFGILFYPVISFDDRWAHRGSVQNLLGADSTETMKTYYSNELQVTPQTPPTLLLLSNNDGTVKPRNSIMFYKALRENRVLTALYIFPSGGHGWGFRDTFAYHEIMKTLILQWIAELWPEQASAPK